MQNFRNLKLWQRARQFTLAVYRLTKDFPPHELYGLTSQIRRACMSIEFNIAEGCGRRSDAELARFLRIAMGSATESECQLLLALDLGYITAAQHKRLEAQLDEIKRMLYALLETVAPPAAAKGAGAG